MDGSLQDIKIDGLIGCLELLQDGWITTGYKDRWTDWLFRIVTGWMDHYRRMNDRSLDGWIRIDHRNISNHYPSPYR